MFYIQLGSDNRIVAFTEGEQNPGPDIWVESPWEYPPEDFNDWLYVDNTLIFSPRVFKEGEIPEPTSEAALSIFLMANPMLGNNFSNKDAIRLKNFIPVFDAFIEYPEGSLVIKFNKVYRKTSIGWQELG